MKKPFMTISHPYPYEFEEKTIKIPIYEYYDNIRANLDDDYMDDRCPNCLDEECESLDGKDCPNPKHEKAKDISSISLQDLLNLIPNDISPKDIHIAAYPDVSSFAVEGYHISFFFTKHVPADPIGFQKAKENYDQAFKKYEEDMKKYNDFLKRQEIKELEKKLKDLKSP